MLGKKIFVRSLEICSIDDKFGNSWQYHSRSDRHSKIACWCILFDLLVHCKLLRQHVKAGRVGFGINHTMHDHRVNRKKDLDLVLCTPSDEFNDLTFLDLAEPYKLVLDKNELAQLSRLPKLRSCDVGSCLLALEAKACMTAHIKALPRLYDELSSSYQTIHGDTNNAIASALVVINLSDHFLSSDRNKFNIGEAPPIVSQHSQPNFAARAFEKMKELPRRSKPDENGYDAIGLILVEMKNDGGPILLREEIGGNQIDKILTYESLIERSSHIYSTRFSSL